jgi:glycogen operon protein
MRLTRFVQRLLALRQALPVLRRNRFLTGEWREAFELRDCAWLDEQGNDLTEEQWHDPGRRWIGMLLDGRAPSSGIDRPSDDATVFVVFNASHEEIDFVMPHVSEALSWELVIDTAQTATSEEHAALGAGQTHRSEARSVQLHILVTDDGDVHARTVREALAPFMEERASD